MGSLATALFPAFSSIKATGDRKMLKGVVNRSLKYTIYLILPVVFGLFVLSEPVVRILFGPDFYPAVLPLKILVFGSLFLTLSKICQSFITGVGKPVSYTRYMIFSGVLNIVLNLILIPPYGLIGAAIATTISLFVLFLLVATFVHKEIGVGLGYLPKPIISAALMLAAIFLIRSYLLVGTWGRVFAVVFLGGVSYFVVLYILGGLDERDRSMISKVVRKIRAFLCLR
jgi:stage V sporulation protein B